jgi:hypothetical protein
MYVEPQCVRVEIHINSGTHLKCLVTRITCVSVVFTWDAIFFLCDAMLAPPFESIKTSYHMSSEGTRSVDHL